MKNAKEVCKITRRALETAEERVRAAVEAAKASFFQKAEVAIDEAANAGEWVAFVPMTKAEEVAYMDISIELVLLDYKAQNCYYNGDKCVKISWKE